MRKGTRSTTRGVVLAIVLSAPAIVATTSAEEEARPPTAADLNWLAGTWRQDRQAEGSVWEETWMAPRDGSVVAVTRHVQGGKPKLYELTVVEDGVEDGEDGAQLRIRHFGPGLDPWKSEAEGPGTWKFVRSAERQAVFEAPERGFPQRLVYHRTADDTLAVSLEGMGDDAEKRMAFSFTRVTGD